MLAMNNKTLAEMLREDAEEDIAITLQDWPPFANQPLWENGPIDGVLRPFLHEFLSRMKLGLSRLDIFHDQGHLLANGTWTGQMGEIIKGAADIALGPVIVTYNISQHAEYSTYYFIDQLRLLSSIQSATGDMLDPFFNISWGVWVALGAFYLMLSSLYLFTEYCEGKIFPKRKRTAVDATRISRLLFNFFAAYFSKGFRHKPRSQLMKYILVLTFLLVLIVTIFVNSLIHTDLVVVPTGDIIDTLYDFFKHPKLCPLIIDNTSQMELIKTSKQIEYVDMNNRIPRCPKSTCIYWNLCSTPEGFQSVANGSYLFLDSRHALIPFGNEICQRWPTTWLHMSQSFSFRTAIAVFRKGLDQRIKDAINRYIENVVHSGLFNVWVDRKSQRLSECFLRHMGSDEEQGVEPVELHSLKRLFYLYLMGCAASMATLILEFIFRPRNRGMQVTKKSRNA